MAAPNEVTLIYDESVGGFPTFQTYVPDSGISLNNRFFTFKRGAIFEHHINDAPRNEFYDTQNDAIVRVIFNDNPSTVKNFKTIGYEGEGNWDATISTDQESTVTNATTIPVTRTISGSINNSEFVDREGKHYGYIRGESRTRSTLDLKSITVQGLGINSALAPNTVTFEADLPSDLAVGDDIYFFQASGNEFLNELRSLGEVVSISVNRKSILYTPSTDIGATSGDFFLFSKDHVADTSGVIGFYGIVEFRSSDTAMNELFSINTEIYNTRN